MSTCSFFVLSTLDWIAMENNKSSYLSITADRSAPYTLHKYFRRVLP